MKLWVTVYPKIKDKMIKTKSKSNRRRKYNIIVMGRAYSPNSRSAGQYKDKVGQEASKVIDRPIKGNLSIRVDYYYNDSKNRLDGDNLLKVICDALKSVAYHDDGQIIEHHVYVNNLNRRIEDPPYPEIWNYFGQGDFIAITISRKQA